METINNNSNIISYDIDQSDGVITFKNINTTLGFVRYNQSAEVEYILSIQCLDVKDLLKNY